MEKLFIKQPITFTTLCQRDEVDHMVFDINSLNVTFSVACKIDICGESENYLAERQDIFQSNLKIGSISEFRQYKVYMRFFFAVGHGIDSLRFVHL